MKKELQILSASLAAVSLTFFLGDLPNAGSAALVGAFIVLCASEVFDRRNWWL